MPWHVYQGRALRSGRKGKLTIRLKEALGLVEIRLLAHFVIGHGETTSFTEMGLI